MSSQRTSRNPFIWRVGTLLALGYFVQKLSNNAEGFSKLPVQEYLLTTLGMTPGEVGVFFMAAFIGWFVKPFWGVIADNIPLGGSRAKGWLIASSLAAGLAWIALGIVGSPNKALLTIALLVTNTCIAFGDVVWDGRMVTWGKDLEQEHGFDMGKGNRPLQVAQWTGAFIAIISATLIGGVLTQFFDLRTTAFVTSLFPIGLAFAIYKKMPAERVAYEPEKMKKGLSAAVSVLVLMFVCFKLATWSPGDGASGFMLFAAKWMGAIIGLIVLGATLIFVKVPKQLLLPAGILLLWQAAPFGPSVQYFKQYWTHDHWYFIQQLDQDTTVLPIMQQFALTFRLTSQEAIDSGQSFINVFYGSGMETITAVFMIVGLLFFRRFLKNTSLMNVMVAAILLSVVASLSYFVFTTGASTSPGLLLAISALNGFIAAIVLLAVLSYGAAKTPATNSATLFALLMGMSNLGATVGKETIAGNMYTDGLVHLDLGWIGSWFPQQAASIPPLNAGEVMTNIISYSILYMLLLLGLIVWLGSNGHIDGTLGDHDD